MFPLAAVPQGPQSPVVVFGILGAVVIVAFIAAFLFRFVFTAHLNNIVKYGRPVKAWIIQANNRLYRSGNPKDLNLPAQVIFTFEDFDGVDEIMEKLAKEIVEIARRPSGLAVDQKVAKLVADDIHNPGPRWELPKKLCKGLTVYFAHVAVECMYLKGRRLRRPYVCCRAMPGASGQIVMTKYTKSKREREVRSRNDDRDDED